MATSPDTTHTRISVEYLKRLKKLAKKNKRTPRQQLEYLIDKANARYGTQ